MIYNIFLYSLQDNSFTYITYFIKLSYVSYCYDNTNILGALIISISYYNLLKQVVENFDEMNLKEELLRGIYAYGFEKPSAIQQRAILPCIRGLDVIAQAQSGKKL